MRGRGTDDGRRATGGGELQVDNNSERRSPSAVARRPPPVAYFGPALFTDSGTNFSNFPKFSLNIDASFFACSS